MDNFSLTCELYDLGLQDCQLNLKNCSFTWR